MNRWLRSVFVTVFGTLIGILVYFSFLPLLAEDYQGGARLLLAVLCGGMGYSAVEGVVDFLEEEDEG